MSQSETDSSNLPITDLLAEFVAKRLSKKAKKSKHKKHKSHHKHKSSSKRKSDEYESDDSGSSRSEKIRSHKKSHHRHRSRSSSRERYRSKHKHRSKSPSRSRKDLNRSSKKRRYSSSQDSSDEKKEKKESPEKYAQQYKSKDNHKPIVEPVTNDDSSIEHHPLTTSGIQIETITDSGKKVTGEVKSLNQVSTLQQGTLPDKASVGEITDDVVINNNTKDSEKTLFNVDIHAIVKDVVNNVITSKSEHKGEGSDMSTKTEDVENLNSTSLLTTSHLSDQSKNLSSNEPILCKDSSTTLSSETSKEKKYKRSFYAKDSDDEDDARYHKRKKHSNERDSKKSFSKSEKYENEREKKPRDQSQERKSEKYPRRNDSKERKDKQKLAEDGEKIDKNKLLEVARRNVLNMIEKGTLPQGLEVSALKKEQLLTMKSGGNSVKELTDFCRTLSEKDGTGASNYDSTIPADESHEEKDQPFIHHPFKVKEASVIKLNIKNAIPLPVKTHAEKVTENARTLSLQFPVSSGNQHRQKEFEWVPVEKNTKSEINTVMQLNHFSATKGSTKAPEKAPVSYPISGPPMPPSSSVPPLPPASLQRPNVPPPPPLNPPPPIPFSLYNSVEQMKFVPPARALLPSPPSPPAPCQPVFSMSSQVPVFQNNLNYSRVFPDMSRRPNERIDLHAIVTQRFKALQKLQENPFDLDARHDIEQAQIKMQAWVESQQVPGQFTGTTNVKLLSPHELCGPRPVWVKKDIFTKAAPVTEGKGMSLLRKMGWNPGEGLGKNKEGTLEPLFLDIKMDKKGLVAEADKKVKILPSVVDDKKNYMIEGKHPVSMLMELCSKRKWPLPLYTEVDETGPAHKKFFLYKVQVNNVEYQPAVSRKNKKLAKADAAVVCLKAMGLLPNNYGN